MFPFLKKKQVETSIFATTAGVVRAIQSLDDGVFSALMLGEGYYILPQSGDIYSPVAGRVDSVFPTKHAIGLKTLSDDDVILHMGVDTVELEGDSVYLVCGSG